MNFLILYCAGMSAYFEPSERSLFSTIVIYLYRIAY